MDRKLEVLQWPNLFLLKPKLIIQTDASLTGWGAVCNGVQKSEQWSEEERTLQIDVVELLAIKLALFCLTKAKRVKSMHFQRDNKEYLLSVLNAAVDVKSRKKTDSSEWLLYLKIFQEVT